MYDKLTLMDTVDILKYNIYFLKTIKFNTAMCLNLIEELGYRTFT